MATTIGDPTRPALVTDGYLDYLDDLFESYTIDVHRASSMLRTVFRLDEREADAIAEFWMNTRSAGGQRDPESGRFLRNSPHHQFSFTVGQSSEGCLAVESK